MGAEVERERKKEMGGEELYPVKSDKHLLLVSYARCKPFVFTVEL